MSAARERGLDALRGILCVLVVTLHVTTSKGIWVGSDSIFGIINNFFAYFRMPVFGFLAGYFYASRVCEGDVRPFLAGKARRLLLPTFSVGISYALLSNWYNSRDVEWIALLIYPTRQFWFLEALFLIFVVVAILETRRLLETPPRLMLVTGVSCGLFLFAAEPLGILGIGGAIYLMPFFLAGVGFVRFAQFRKADIKPALAATVLFGSIYVGAGIFGFGNPTGPVSIIGLILGVAGACLAVQVKWNSHILERIGRHGLAIFVFHIFFIAGLRLTAQALDVFQLDIVILMCITGSIAGSIALEKAVSRVPILNTVLLGARFERRADNQERDSSEYASRTSP